ncbi:MAG: redoxin domain-containing protein [Polyangiaceae bacterium]|nr:redoxin domain-containing protein [Myxococcales bacterium]MCB9585841.1 redoxin domain-containing protein [Polyangiaceae bacterium]
MQFRIGFGSALTLAACALTVACGAPSEPVKAPEDSQPVLFPEGMDPDAPQSAGWLGAELALAAPDEPGVRVAAVLPRSPAARAGLQAQDVIMSIDGETMNSPDAVVMKIKGAGAGKRVAFGVRRAGKDRLLAVTLGERPSEGQLVEQAYVGAKAPDFQGLVGVQGQVPASIGGYRGKVVLVEFWADWCMVCRMLVPTMKQWHRRWAGQGVEILAITTDTLDVAVRSSVEQELDYAVAADLHGKTSVAYHAYALPSVFLIDQQGVVRDLMVGFDERKIAELERTVDALLAGAPQAPAAGPEGLAP